ERTRGRKGPTTLPLCQKVGGSFRSFQERRKCLLTSPGHESGVRDSRGGPAVSVVWLIRPWRGIVLKKSQLGEDRCNFGPRRTDHTEKEHRPTGADSGHGGEPPVFSLADPNWRTYIMATAAQIEANRLNAQRSTGPKTDEGKARAKLNAITHGMTARTIMPVLPQEDPKELE